MKRETNSCDEPVFETTNFSEEVLKLKDLEHIPSRIWLNFVKIGTVVFEIRARI